MSRDEGDMESRPVWRSGPEVLEALNNGALADPGLRLQLDRCTASVIDARPKVCCRCGVHSEPGGRYSDHGSASRKNSDDRT